MILASSIFSEPCGQIRNQKFGYLWSSKQDTIFLKFAYIDLDMGRGRLGLARPAVFEGPHIKLSVKHFWE